jgi:nitrite reductase/ring-hydroxylating ferredoxin subunit
MPMTEQWTEVAKAEDVPEQGTLLVQLAGEPVCLYNIDGRIYATHDTCTHGHASLADGFILEGSMIECPLHQGTFDVKTGRALGVPCTEDIRSYVVKIENGVVLLKE